MFLVDCGRSSLLPWGTCPCNVPAGAYNLSPPPMLSVSSLWDRDYFRHVVGHSVDDTVKPAAVEVRDNGNGFFSPLFLAFFFFLRVATSLICRRRSGTGRSLMVVLPSTTSVAIECEKKAQCWDHYSYTMEND